MIIKKIRFVFLIITISIGVLFTQDQDDQSEKKETKPAETNKFYFNYHYTKLPKSDNIIGKIKLNKIKNLRISDSTDDILVKDTNFIGNLRGPAGKPFPILTYKHKELDVLFKDLIKNSLNYSGYEVLDMNSKESVPILNVDILDFYLDGYIGYGIFSKLDITLKHPDKQIILFRDTIEIEIGFALFDTYGPMFNAINFLFDEISFRTAFLFQNKQFRNSVLNLVPADIITLSFKGKKINKIPENFENKDKIFLLDLSHNKINKIENLQSLNKLEFLTFKVNNIKTIENLDNLTSLKGLNFRNNKLKKIENLSNLANLEYLNFAFNSIKNIENIDGLKNLLYLSFNDDNLVKISGLDSLSKLLILDISDCDDLTKISSLDNLKNLIALNINESSEIRKIEGLSNLVNLKELILSGNKIKKIENLSTLVNLDYLDLSENEIGKIENLETLINLKELNLKGNPISIVLGGTLLSKIENLEQLKNLETLNLSFNRIKLIENLGSLKKLKELNLSINKITKIENIEQLDNLKILRLFDGGLAKISNKIKTITKSSYDFLKQKNVELDEGLNIDDFLTKYKIKIE